MPDYHAEDFTTTLPVADYVARFRNAERFIECCRVCRNFGRGWGARRSTMTSASYLVSWRTTRGTCILFSTHELDIALSLADSIALIDPPQLYHLPTAEMQQSGLIEKLFRPPTLPANYFRVP